jgi:hypothetical protein
MISVTDGPHIRIAENDCGAAKSDEHAARPIKVLPDQNRSTDPTLPARAFDPR